MKNPKLFSLFFVAAASMTALVPALASGDSLVVEEEEKDEIQKLLFEDEEFIRRLTSAGFIRFTSTGGNGGSSSSSVSAASLAPVAVPASVYAVPEKQSGLVQAVSVPTSESNAVVTSVPASINLSNSVQSSTEPVSTGTSFVLPSVTSGTSIAPVASPASTTTSTNNRGIVLVAETGGDGTETTTGTTYTITGDGDSRIFTAKAEDKIIFNKTSGYLANRDSQTIKATVEIQNLILKDGYSGESVDEPKWYIFENTVTGTGELKFDNGSANYQGYAFQGDVSGYSGNMTIHENKQGTFKFTKNTGTGKITAKHANSVLELATGTGGTGVELKASEINVGKIKVTGTTTGGDSTLVNVSAGKTFVVEGGGHLAVNRFVGVDAASGTATATISAGTTMTIKGNQTSNLGDTGSFMLANWGGAMNFNVSGTLILNSGISNRDGTGTLNVKNGGNVELKNGLSFATNGGTVKLNVEFGGTVKITGGTLGTNKQDRAFISGAGRIEIASNVDPVDNKNLGANFQTWTGTVAFANITKNNLALNSYGVTGSTIELEGFSGYFAEYNGTVNPNLHLVNGDSNYALKITNGTSSGVITFARSISGSGELQMAWGSSTAMKFTGDVSAYTGKISHSGNYSRNLTFERSTASTNQDNITGTGEISWNGNVIFNYSHSAVGTVANKITATCGTQNGSDPVKLIKRGTGTLKFTNENSFKDGVSIESGTLIAGHNSALGMGTVEIKTGGRLQIGEATVTRAAGDSITLQNTAYTIVLGSGNYTSKESAAIFGSGKIAGTSTITVDLVSTAALDANSTYYIYSGADAANFLGKVQKGTQHWSSVEGNWNFILQDNSIVLAIPEPSLFGLLAGMGALALVGSRRRRCK